MKIAILGATGHIAQGLIFSFIKEYSLHLYTRNTAAVYNFLKENNLLCYNCVIQSTTEFGKVTYDAIINCIGLGSPINQKNNLQNIFSITEYFDNLIIDYLSFNKYCYYINMSSGSVYGSNLTNKAFYENSPSVLSINNIAEGSYYQVTKLYSEVKHRASKSLKIIDLRIFGYFSRFIALDSGFLITDMLLAIKNNVPFHTNKNDIVRDYISFEELAIIIKTFFAKKMVLNDAFDLYSKKPVSKFELIDYFTTNFNMKVIYESSNFTVPTGDKTVYYSQNKKIQNVTEYVPLRTSLEVLTKEISFMSV